tara:strand:- start:114 stop:1595 length:1482 start_codon:yes stop_codon:yes gene_type:complete
MANTRPFTYNNGSTISGSNQIGDLAYGDLNDVNNGPNYDNNPGGKKWWMGPDEDSRYIIGKDVSTSDWPTPVPEGDIGSVRFWATSTENDTQFIGLTNSVGGNSFSTTAASWSWLTLGGYFTNYPRPANSSERAQLKVYKNESNPTSYGANRIDFSTTQDTAYFYRTSTGATETWGNNGIAFYPNVSNIVIGDSISISGSGAYLPTVTNSDNNTRGRGTFAIDNSDNRLYVNAGDTAIQYNISNNTAVANVKLTGASTTDNAYKPTHSDNQNKLFLPQLDKIRIVNTTNMTYSTSDDIDVETDFGKTMALAIADNDNDRVLCAGDGYFIIVDATDNSVAYSSSISGGVIDNAAAIPGFGVHVSSENAYFMNCGIFIGPTTGDNIPYILKISDSSPYTQTLYSLDNRAVPSPSTWNTYTSVSYDSTNNYIWAMNTERDICYLDIDAGTITHTDITFRGSSTAIAPFVTSNSGLWIGTNTNNNTVKMYDTRLILS